MMTKAEKRIKNLKYRFDENSRLIAKQKLARGIMVGDKNNWISTDSRGVKSGGKAN